MKNIISVIILMVGLFVCMANGTQVTASTLTGQGVFPSTNSGTMVSTSSPTTISAKASSTIEASVSELAEPVEKGNFFTINWGTLLMGLLGFADLVARLTPTKKDNSIINFLSTIINAIIPNLKKGGGSFKLESK